MDRGLMERLMAAAGINPKLNSRAVTPDALRAKARDLAAAYAHMLEMRPMIPKSMRLQFEKLLEDMRKLAISMQTVTGIYDQSAAWILALVGGRRADVVNQLTAAVSIGMYAALTSMMRRYRMFIGAMQSGGGGQGRTSASGVGGLGTLDGVGVSGVSWTAIVLTGGLVLVFVWPAVRRWWRKR